MSRTSNLTEAFGLYLRLVRQAAGQTQEELAFKSGLHRTYISLLERGAKSPTIDTLFRLCEALNQEPDHFIREVMLRVDSEPQIDAEQPTDSETGA